MPRHRSHSIEFKRQVAQEFIAGETLHGLAAGFGGSARAFPNGIILNALREIKYRDELLQKGEETALQGSRTWLSSEGHTLCHKHSLLTYRKRLHDIAHGPLSFSN
jgi:hypothetical protein